MGTIGIFEVLLVDAFSKRTSPSLLHAVGDFPSEFYELAFDIKS